jgi:hypothetical protein
MAGLEEAALIHAQPPPSPVTPLTHTLDYRPPSTALPDFGLARPETPTAQPLAPAALLNPFETADDRHPDRGASGLSVGIHPDHRASEPRPISIASSDVYGGMLESMLAPDAAPPRPSFAAAFPETPRASSDH